MGYSKNRFTFAVGGGTNTAGALSLASAVLFNSSMGGRDDAKKVVVLVTDGMSHSFNDTEAEAKSLRVRRSGHNVK